MDKSLNPYLVTAALECAKQNPDGFTIAPDMLTQPTEGYAVAMWTDKENKGTIGFLNMLAYCLEYNRHFGGWLDKKTGTTHWDAVKIFPVGQLKEATIFAEKEQQLALFDLSNGVEIRLD